jgi:protein-disulfide isomerase
VSFSRRRLLALLLGSGAIGALPLPAPAQAPDSWFDLLDDSGRPVANLRVPVELTDEIELLRGAIWTGAQDPDVTVVEFYDYNCPWCRKAAGDLKQLKQDRPGLRLGLVNNPILSPQSVDAAKIEIAITKMQGKATAARLYEALFARRGVIDGERALDAAESLGLSRAEIAEAARAADVAEALDVQTRLAASLGMAATPSFVIGGTGVLGYPGPRTMARMTASARECGQIVC